MVAQKIPNLKVVGSIPTLVISGAHCARVPFAHPVTVGKKVPEF